MNKEEILTHLKTHKEGTLLSDTDKKIVEIFGAMKQKERMDFFMDIIDDPEIELVSDVMKTLMQNHTPELEALRVANKQSGNLPDGNETIVERAYESLK